MQRALLCALVLAAAEPSARAACHTLVVELEPVAYPAALDPKGAREAGGPQLAVWLADAAGRWVADVAVTRLVATLGLGNRPGAWNFASSPKFPYGRRVQALPVWAHARAAARGVDYPLVVFNDGVETSTRFHNAVSSSEPYYCRPLLPQEIVDAVTCPTPRFSSCKGKLDPALRSPYPPRGDLASFEAGDAPDAEQLAALDDLDAVATATPRPGTRARWAMPLGGAIPAGDYQVLVEVGKEFDTNEHHRYPTQADSLMSVSYGDPENLGQPSIVWAVPIHLGDAAAAVRATEALGYGPPDGVMARPSAIAAELTTPIDATISDTPGSGLGRLLLVLDPAGAFKVLARTADCDGDGQSACGAAPASPRAIAPSEGALGATAVTLRIDVPPGDLAVRYRAGTSMTEAEFAAATPAPAAERDGDTAFVHIDGLKPEASYAAGARVVAPCGQTSPLAVTTFRTPAIAFKTVDGCFLATAAFGSPLAAEVGALRTLRDRVLLKSVPGRIAVAAYYQVSPPLARWLAGSDAARAVARAWLAPLVRLAGQR